MVYIYSLPTYTIPALKSLKGSTTVEFHPKHKKLKYWQKNKR